VKLLSSLWLAAWLVAVGLTPAQSQPNAPASDAGPCAHGDASDTVPACRREKSAAGHAAAEDAASSAPALDASTPTPAASPSTAAAAQAYAQGRADRQQWESWFVGQSGNFYAGAAYWASHRSLTHRQSCAAAAPADADSEWAAGCIAAQRALARPDRLRNASRAYRRGWNSVPAALASSNANSGSAPRSSAGWATSGFLWIVGLAVIALILVMRQGKAKARTQTAYSPRQEPRRTAAASSSPSNLPPLQRSQHGGPPHPTVSADELRRESEAAWRSTGDVVQVQGITIPDGLIYVGSSLRAQDGFGAHENCLIDPSLSADGTETNPDQHLTYWPSYSRLPSSTRRAYLSWLATDRANPDTAIGYVFLYFYGLERRLMLDQSPADRLTVVAEVERLRLVYGGNASFRGYSGRLLNAATVLSGANAPATPSFERTGYELPFGLKYVLGRFVAAGEPIPPDWMLSWLINDPQFYLRTPATRDVDTFKEVFALRWAQTKPKGAVFTDSQRSKFPQLRFSYRAASNTFNISHPIGDGIPDVSGSRHIVRKAQEVALKCCDDLDAYSRLIGRRPELKGSITAGALLPPEAGNWRRARENLIACSATREPRTVRDIINLLDGADSQEKITPARWRKAAEALSMFGFGVVPDPELTLLRISPALPATIFPLPHGSNTVPEVMSATALVLQIGALVATADGVVSAEARHELEHAADQPNLDPRQSARLKAQADWLLSNPARPTDLQARLAEASAETRNWIVEVALDLARKDGHIVSAEVKQLEQVFAWLGLPSVKLYSALHGSEPVEIVSADPGPQGHAIPPPAPQRRQLDRDKIAAIARDSAKSAELLQTVFGAEEEPEPAMEPQAIRDGAAFAGLSETIAAFAQAVCEREEWSRAELAAVAQAHGVMLDGAIERLNDWALDRWDDLLIEDGDPVRVSRHFLSDLIGV
jgi:tellurite resistance protein